MNNIFYVNIIQLFILTAGFLILMLLPNFLDNKVSEDSSLLLSPLRIISYYNEGYYGAINLVLDNK